MSNEVGSGRSAPRRIGGLALVVALAGGGAFSWGRTFSAFSLGETLGETLGERSIRKHPGSEASWGSTVALADEYLPVVPKPTANDEEGRALAEFFERYPDTSMGGLIDVERFDRTDITRLRAQARAIMGRNTTCGTPRAQDKGVEYCFWEGDFVSQSAMNAFCFERIEWNWVVDAFRDEEVARHSDCLAFLDAGVNVGDWAVPIRVALPNLTYFGIEGMPSTAAVAAANMMTAVEYHRQRNTSIVAPTVLLPFPVLNWRSLEKARSDGGVCYRIEAGNVGGSNVKASSAENMACDAKSTAGGTLLAHGLKHMAARFQPSCNGVWPSIYIAKFDIQGFEFSALSSAMDWLQQRPPCYLMLEMTNGHSQNHALMQLLVDLGYDSAWRMANGITNELLEKPPDPPYWTSGNVSRSVFQAYEEDMKGRTKWHYKNYVFGFQDRDGCIRRLLNGTGQ